MAGIDIAALGATAARIGMGLAGTALGNDTLTIGGTRAYVAATDAVGLTGSVVVTVPALGYKKKERQSPDVEITDKKFSARSKMLLIETAALVAAGMPAGTLIRETDTLVEDGLKWNIFEADTDPSGATWILDIRR